jgi:NADPH-dependent 2,4-dienoyl-CoA reductase/sulfur reductase-like enzyme
MRVVLAGGGLAAQRCAEALRASGHDGPITMLAAEPHPPYDRPPLSKALLTGGAPDVALRPAGWYAAHGVDLRVGAAAAGLDAHRGRVRLAGGGEVIYDRLLIATGARPIVLPGLGGPANVQCFRTLEDAVALAAVLRPGLRLAVLGAGLIGQELASAACARGAHPTLVDGSRAPFDALLGPGAGALLARVHERAGVDLRLGRRLAAVRRAGETVAALVLDDDAVVECDHVVVAVGVRPETSWTGRAPGAALPPGILRAGDAAGGGHWEAAARQGAATARAMLGLPARGEPAPLVWSDQHGLRLQRLGDPRGADNRTVDGDPDAGDLAVTFHRAGRPVAITLVGRPGALPAARRRLRDAFPDQEAA